MGTKSWSVDWSQVDWSKNNAEIARELGLDTSSVWSKRKHLGIKASKGNRRTGIEELPTGAAIDWDATERFNDGKSTRRILCLRCCDCKQWRHVRTVNIAKIKSGHCKRCKKCSKQKRIGSGGIVGRHHNSSGYVVRTISSFSQEEQDFLSAMANQHGRRQPEILEHRAVMALALGRVLLSDELVHHINGIKDDNRPENLSLAKRDEHAGEHRNIIVELKRLRAENQRLRKQLNEVKSQS